MIAFWVIGIPVKISWPNGDSTFAAQAFSCHLPLNTVPKEPTPRISALKIRKSLTVTVSAGVMNKDRHVHNYLL